MAFLSEKQPPFVEERPLLIPLPDTAPARMVISSIPPVSIVDELSRSSLSVHHLTSSSQPLSSTRLSFSPSTTASTTSTSTLAAAASAVTHACTPSLSQSSLYSLPQKLNHIPAVRLPVVFSFTLSNPATEIHPPPPPSIAASASLSLSPSATTTTTPFATGQLPHTV